MLPGQGTGYTSVSDYLDANAGTLANEGAQITSEVGGRIDAAHGAADQLIAADQSNYTPDYTTLPGYQDSLDKAIAAKDETTALGSQGGVSDYFQRHLGDTRSQGDFDASLLGASGRLDVHGLQSRAGGLIDYLNHGLSDVKPAAPAAPERRPAQDPDQQLPTGYPDHTHPPGPPALPGAPGYVPPYTPPSRRPAAPGRQEPF